MDVVDLGLPDRRDAAAVALAALGSDAVPPLAGELIDEASPMNRREIRSVLGRLRPDGNAAQESRDHEDEWTWTAFDPAPDIARSLGVSPLTIEPDTPSRGTGVLALTPYGVAHDAPAGAHRV
jgi:hypothetical protein